MKQQVDLGQWQALTPGARRRWEDWCAAHDEPPPQIQRRARWEDEGRLWHAPSVGQLIEYLAEREHLDRDRWGLLVLPCAHDALGDLCDALWAATAALLDA